MIMHNACWLVAAVCLAGCDPSEEYTAYREDFDRYGDWTASFAPSVGMGELPPSLKFLDIRAVEAERAVRDGFFTVPGGISESTYAVYFDYVFREKEDEPRIFTLRFFFEGGVTRDVVVDGEKPGIPGGWAYQHGALSVSDGCAALFLHRNGVQVKDFETSDWPKRKLLGWNVVTRSAVWLDFVRINANTARPWLRGDVREWLDAKKAEAKTAAKADLSPLTLVLADGTKSAITFRTGDIDRKAGLTNATVRVSWPNRGGLDVFVRPKLNWRFLDPEKAEITAAWNELPGADTHRPDIALYAVPGIATNAEIWVDGRYAGCVVTPAPIVEPALKVRDPRTITFDLSATPYKLERCRENQGSFYLECNGFQELSPFEGLVNTTRFTVPIAQYSKAVAYVTVDPTAPRDFVPEITARLTEYQRGSGRSQAACDVTRRIDDSTERVTLDDGTTAYRVEFVFDVGSLQDLTSMLKNIWKLDLDFLGPLHDKDDYYISRKRSPSFERQSNLVLHKVELVRSPIAMVVRPARTGSTYYPDEKPGLTVAFDADAGAKGVFSCRVTDRSGKIVAEPVKGLVVDGCRDVKVDLPRPSDGLFKFECTLDVEGAPTLCHAGSYACLPPDTRQATKLDSPYYIWNFDGAHGTPSDSEIWGDAAKRLGVRRTGLSVGRAKDRWENAPDVSKWGITLAQFPFLAPRNATTQEYARVKAEMLKYRTAFPSCKHALLYHESGSNGPMPRELIGEKTVVDAQQISNDVKRAWAALESAKLWREVDPSVRLIIGNAGLPVRLLAQCFRVNFPRELMDALGDESVGMTMLPERTVAYSSWILQKLAREFGYKGLEPDAPWEWKSRVERHFGEEKVAAFHVRDALICHAWNYTTIPLAGYSEMANSYYDTIWGDSAFSRYPLFYPRMTFVAEATLTRVLDRAKFTRLVPTGSTVAYAVEFRCPDGKTVTAVWSARGDAKATPLGGGALAGIGFCGESFDPAKDLVVGESPCYIVSEKPLDRIDLAEGDRTYPFEADLSGLPETVAQPMASAAEVVLDAAVDRRIENGVSNTVQYCFNRPGPFAVSNASDPVRGKAVELTWKGELKATPELMNEYVMLRFPEAKPVAGPANTVGVWVKGNGSWGRLRFEITDAEGEVWFSAGTGGYGDAVYDWPDRLALNFEGWHYLAFPLTKDSPVKVYGPGENEWQWQRDGAKGNGRIDFPVKVTGLGVAMTPWTLNLKEMVPAKPSILLQGVSFR